MRLELNARTALAVLSTIAIAVCLAAPASAQPTTPATPGADQPATPETPPATSETPPATPETPPATPETPPATPETPPATPDVWEAPTPDAPPLPPPGPTNTVTLRVHVINTRNGYERVAFDVFDIATREVVGSGRGSVETAGELPASFEVAPGSYKIVKAGEPFETRIDFATVTIGEDTDYVIVVDAETLAFRGSGLVTDELPDGIEVAGIRVALNVGGTLWLNQKKDVIGKTNGVTSLVGLFGNFSLVFDRGSHFLALNSDLQLNVRDPEVGGAASTTDFFEGSALYAFNINNPYVGPYARASFKTSVFPGYLYLEDLGNTGQVQVNRPDGRTETFVFGSEAHPDDLRMQLSEPLSPFIIQEELGANLKAVDMDLALLNLSVATRAGWGFRHGITNGLLVVDGSERGSPVVLNEVENYFTTGPALGANATVTFARWLFGKGQFGMVVPVHERARAGSNFGRRLLIDFSGTAGLKFPALTSLLHASFDYTFRLQRDGYLTRDTIVDQVLMARVSLQLF